MNIVFLHNVETDKAEPLYLGTDPEKAEAAYVKAAGTSPTALTRVEWYRDPRLPIRSITLDPAHDKAEAKKKADAAAAAKKAEKAKKVEEPTNPDDL